MLERTVRFADDIDTRAYDLSFALRLNLVVDQIFVST